MNCETQEEIDPATAGLGEAHRWRRKVIQMTKLDLAKLEKAFAGK